MLETSEKADTLPTLPKAWQIWMNPIFHRYRRSRLRLSSLITGALVYGGASLFFYLVALGYTVTKTSKTIEETAIYPFAFTLFLQVFILTFVGTGEVAAGMARESIDRVLTYQRLTPLSPATKIMGYLTGLPVRQFYHFVITLPVTVLIIRTGSIPFEIWGSIYAVLATSTIMFYLLAMSVGFIMGKKFSALISQGLVFMLYFALPQLSNFGFVIFEYLTLRPVVFSAAQKVNDRFGLIDDHSSLFYHWELSHAVYSIALQSLLSWIFLCLLLRRWRLESSHLLSKVQCLVIAGILHFLVLGGIWANTANGSMLVIKIKSHAPYVAETVRALNENIETISAAVLSLYGLIGLTCAILLQYIYTPSRDAYLAGFRKHRRRSRRFFAVFKDSSSGIPISVSIALISLVMWWIYGLHLADSPKVADFIAGASLSPVFSMLVAVTLIPLVAHACMLESLGRKLTSTLTCFMWVLPLAAALLLSAWSFSEDLASVLFGLSPLTMVFAPGYALANLHNPEGPHLFATGCHIGLAIYSLLAIYFLARIILRHRHYITTHLSLDK